MEEIETNSTTLIKRILFYKYLNDNDKFTSSLSTWSCHCFNQILLELHLIFQS